MKHKYLVNARHTLNKVRHTKALTAMGISILTVMAPPLAIAAPRGWYAGANVGQSRAKIADGQITSRLQSEGFTSSSISNDSQGTGFKLFAGYQFNRYFAVEGGYFNLGDVGYSASTVPTGTANGSMAIQGLNIDAVGILPITQRFSAFGRVGVTYINAHDTFSGTGAYTAPTSHVSQREANYKYGVGLQYALTQRFAVRTEAERYRIKDAIGNTGDVDLISVGLVYRFGGQHHHTPQQTRTYLAPTAAVTPAYHHPKAVAVPVVVKLGDVYFKYNKATLTPKGKAVLDHNIRIMQHNPGYQFRVAGYTSAAGTTKYNQALSVARAHAVKEYLMDNGGIAADRLTTIGFGDTRPAQFESRPSHLRSKAALANMRVLFEITVH